MEIDGATAAIGLVMMALFSVPYMADQRVQWIRRKQLLAALQAYAQQHGCVVDVHEQFGEMVLGLDKGRKVLLQHSTLGDVITNHHVDLSEVRTCHTHKTSRSTPRAGTKATRERLELWLLPKDTSKAEWRLVLCEIMNVDCMKEETAMANRWVMRINALLKGK